MSTKMARTLITLLPKDMRWLRSISKRRGQSLAMTIREAVAEYRVKRESGDKTSAIEATAGLWKDHPLDALDYVEKLRAEWH